MTLSFGVPQALWLLLALPLIVLFHMLRARRLERAVSSTLLWERAARDLAARLPVRRLERSLILILQLLAAAALALAAAHPVVGLSGLSGPGLVLLFDTSLSMQATDGGGGLTRFAAAQAAARSLLDRAGAGQPVMVMTAGAAPRAVTGFVSEVRAQRDAIRRIAPSDGPADLEAAVRAAVGQRVAGRPAQVVVFSDQRGSAIRNVSYRTFGGAAQNLALTRAAASPGGGDVTLLLTELRNFGAQGRSATVRVTWPGGATEAATLAIPAGGVATRIWTGRGDGVARVDLQSGDVLAADDRAAVLIGRARLPRVLLVSPGNPYLEAVLRVLPVRSAGRTATVRPEAWGAYDLIILDRIPPVTLPPGRFLMIGTVANGLPIEVTGAARAVTVLRSQTTHPLLRLVDLDGIRVDEALALRTRGGVVLAEGEVPLLWAHERPDQRVVLLPFDLLRSDLPVHTAFPLLMANTLEWLAPVTSVEAGATLRLPAPDGRVELVDPAGRARVLTAQDGAVTLPALDRAGIYVLKAGEREQLFVVTPAAGSESDLRAAPTAAGRLRTEPGRRQMEVWIVPVLLGLVLLVLEWALWLRTLPAPLLRPRRRPLLLLRLGVLALLLVALAGLQIARGGGDLSLIFALDLSDSVAAAERERAFALMPAAARLGRPGDRYGLVSFGEGAAVEEGLTTTPRFALSAPPSGLRTDVGAAIRAALGLLPPEEGRIALLTDGLDTEGGASRAAAIAAAAGVELYLVPLTAPAGPEARIAALTVPRAVRVGERFEARVWVAASAPASGTLSLRARGREVWRGPAAVREGSTLLRIPLQATASGVLTYEATLTVSPDDLEDNNRAHALLQVLGPPEVLYVTAQEGGALARWLRAQGVALRAIAPEDLPTETAALTSTPAVVLDDVPATSLTPAQMRALSTYVTALGGGLLAVGGPHAFGVGGYAGTDLEAVLPVSMDVRHRVAIPSLAVVLVVDASGSMGSFGGEIAKVELAKEAAQAVVDLLGARDLIGVIAFDQEPHWLVRPMEASRRDQILSQVSRITAGGGTNLYPALQEAYRALQGAGAKVKHVIVLSDGQTDPGDFERLVGRMKRAKITVSSVAIGGDADREIMRDLAGWGGGRYYFTRDLYTIPQIVTAEAVLATRAYLIEERFRPRAAPGSPLLEGLTPLPALRGYVATAAKPSGTLHALTGQQDPLLATWQIGLGRAAAFTSDATARWAAEWYGWPGAPAFWSRLLRWVVAPPQVPLEVRAGLERDRVRIVLDARDPQGRRLTDLRAEAQIVGAAAVSLTQTAPGIYEGEAAVRTPGAYLVTVEARRNERVAGVGRTTVTVPYSPELIPPDGGSGAVARLVEETGARVVTTPAELAAPPPGGARRQPLWPYLVTSALGLFVIDVALRRLPVAREIAARALAALGAWVRRAPARAGSEDREYEVADQWRPPPGEPQASSDMEQAARLYIARLRRQQESDRRRE
ncbi:MAG: VWA domain-containing protein [bacterium]